LLKKELATIHAGDPDTVIIDELALLHGSCRADVAVVNGMMHGFELKSDRDTLDRLPEQARAYAAVFDYVTLVVGERHLLDAIEIIPDWWGIRVARFYRGKLVLRDLRLAMVNTSPDLPSTVRLLWRGEALKILAEVSNRKAPTSRPREWIYSELLARVEFGHLRDAVRHCLKNRRTQRPDDM